MYRGTTGSVYITSLYLATVKGLWFPLCGDANLLMQQLVYASNLGCWLPLAGIFYDSRHGGPRNTGVLAGWRWLGVGLGPNQLTPACLTRCQRGVRHLHLSTSTSTSTSPHRWR